LSVSLTACLLITLSDQVHNFILSHLESITTLPCTIVLSAINLQASLATSLRCEGISDHCIIFLSVSVQDCWKSFNIWTWLLTFYWTI